MRRFAPLLALPLLVAPTVAAQSGTISYDRADRLNFELPPGMKDNPRFANMPNARMTKLVLHFTPEATLQARSDAGRPAGAAQAMRGGEMRALELSTMRGGGGGDFVFMGRASGGGASSRRNAEEILESYTDLGDGKVTESVRFMGRTFRLSRVVTSYRWKLTAEQSLFLDHMVMKATTEHEGDQVEAWFAPDIPIQGGPEGFGGLPGMILTLNVNDGERTYTATTIELGEPAVEMKAPTDGNEIGREEYEKIVAERLAEMEKARGGRRGGETIEIIRKDG